MITPYQAMQKAVDIVNTSEHAHNKIAACLFWDDNFVVKINHRPNSFKTHFQPGIKIGNSSQFIHAEMACLFDTDWVTEGTSLAVTDPPCPNCAKIICEAGIKHVYIDHKGMEKDFAARRRNDFETLSLLMFEKAGVDVSILYRKNGREEIILKPSGEASFNPEGILTFDWTDQKTIEDYLGYYHQQDLHGIWALAHVTSNIGILIYESLTPGIETAITPSLKYRFPIDPINRLLAYLTRTGQRLENNLIACNLHPSSRAMVNAVGYGIKTIMIADAKPDHDPECHDAAETLTKNGILNIERLK